MHLRPNYAILLAAIGRRFRWKGRSVAIRLAVARPWHILRTPILTPPRVTSITADRKTLSLYTNPSPSTPAVKPSFVCFLNNTAANLLC